MKINEITEQVIGAAIRVHRFLGPGLLESAYEACLCSEIRNSGLRVEQQKPIPLIFRDVKMDCGYRLDILVEDQVIVEVKSVEHILPVHKSQVLSHLRLLNRNVGLLINFNVAALKDGITRLVNKYEGPMLS
jgi:GxxExxY protein